MARAKSEYKAARLFLTEERGGLVTVRFAVKPINEEWHVMHSLDSINYRDYQTPLDGVNAVLAVFNRYTEETRLPF